MMKFTKTALSTLPINALALTTDKTSLTTESQASVISARLKASLTKNMLRQIIVEPCKFYWISGNFC